MGELPIGKSLGYLEVLDDGNEMGETKDLCTIGKTIRSLDKHADYDFTLNESVVTKDGGRNGLRKVRFTFSENLDEIRVEYINLTSMFKTPIILYFQEKK